MISSNYRTVTGGGQYSPMLYASRVNRTSERKEELDERISYFSQSETGYAGHVDQWNINLEIISME